MKPICIAYFFNKKMQLNNYAVINKTEEFF